MKRKMLQLHLQKSNNYCLASWLSRNDGLWCSNSHVRRRGILIPCRALVMRVWLRPIVQSTVKNCKGRSTYFRLWPTQREDSVTNMANNAPGIKGPPWQLLHIFFFLLESKSDGRKKYMLVWKTVTHHINFVDQQSKKKKRRTLQDDLFVSYNSRRQGKQRTCGQRVSR
jgi:hypothetical protein